MRFPRLGKVTSPATNDREADRNVMCLSWDLLGLAIYMWLSHLDMLMADDGIQQRRAGRV